MKKKIKSERSAHRRRNVGFFGSRNDFVSRPRKDRNVQKIGRAGKDRYRASEITRKPIF